MLYLQCSLDDEGVDELNNIKQYANNSIYTGSGREQVYPAEEYQAVLWKAFGVLEHRGS